MKLFFEANRMQKKSKFYDQAIQAMKFCFNSIYFKKGNVLQNSVFSFCRLCEL